MRDATQDELKKARSRAPKAVSGKRLLGGTVSLDVLLVALALDLATHTYTNLYVYGLVS